MKSNKPKVILVLMFILLFLIVLSIVLNLKPKEVETFQGSSRTTQASSSSENLFENTYDFVDYSRNSDKFSKCKFG